MLLSAFANHQHRWCLGTVPIAAGGKRVWATFGEIERRVRRLGVGFRALLASGSSIGICGNNSEDWVVSDLAALIMRLVVVPLDPKTSIAELGQMVQLARVEVIVCGPSCVGR